MWCAKSHRKLALSCSDYKKEKLLFCLCYPCLWYSYYRFWKLIYLKVVTWARYCGLGHGLSRCCSFKSTLFVLLWPGCSKSFVWDSWLLSPTSFILPGSSSFASSWAEAGSLTVLMSLCLLVFSYSGQKRCCCESSTCVFVFPDCCGWIVHLGGWC